MLDHGDIVWHEAEGPFKYIYVKTRTDLGCYQVWLIGDNSVVHKPAKSSVGLFHPGRQYI